MLEGTKKGEALKALPNLHDTIVHKPSSAINRSTFREKDIRDFAENTLFLFGIIPDD